VSISFNLTRDDVTPAINLMLRAARNPQPLLRAMGTTFKSITEGNFNSAGASFRPAPWKPKRDGLPSILQSRNPTLSKSFHMTLAADSVTISNPMIYAAIHQLGGEIRPKNAKALKFFSGGRWWTVKKVTMPARPYMPILPDGRLTSAAATLIERACRRAFERQAGIT
jgi:phage gpG-like protein